MAGARCKIFTFLRQRAPTNCVQHTSSTRSQRVSATRAPQRPETESISDDHFHHVLSSPFPLRQYSLKHELATVV